jgi:hypothetical protein
MPCRHVSVASAGDQVLKAPNTESPSADRILRIRSFSCHAFGIGRKLIAVNSLVELPRLHGPGCHAFCGLAGSNGILSVKSSRMLRYSSTPGPQKRLFPFHLDSPYVSPSLQLRAFVVN